MKGTISKQHRVKPQHEFSNCNHLNELSLIRGQVVLGLYIGDIFITDTKENMKIISDRVFRIHCDWAWNKPCKKKGPGYWCRERERESTRIIYFHMGRAFIQEWKVRAVQHQELMIVKKWWQSCERARRMALLRSLVSAFLSSDNKFINFSSKYSHGWSIAAVQGFGN